MFFYLVGLFLVVSILQALIKNNTIPDSIGLVDGDFKKLPKNQSGVSSQAIDKTKFVEALPFQGSYIESKEKLLQILGKNNGMEIIKDVEDYMHIVLKKGFFSICDDVELIFDRTLCKIQYKSVSRVGLSGRKINKTRYSQVKKIYLD